MPLSFAPGDDPASYGHHFVVGLQPETVLTDHDKRLLERLKPAGIVVFKPNFRHDLPYDEWLAIYGALIEGARACIGRDELLVGIDHEGGNVVRPPAPITAYAAARDWPDKAAEVGRAMAVELRSLAVNVSFAPVLDIDSNPANPVIGKRAFGTTAEAVSEAAGRFLQSLQGEGVTACLKHFPGHGDTSGDSHHELPVLDLDIEALRARELSPFQALVAQGAGMVMTAHILFPRIDPDTPATISAKLLNGVLRGELGFDGVVISDDIGMHAASDIFARPETMARAVNAGCDLITVCSYWTDTRRALELAANLHRSLQDGAIQEPALSRSFDRVNQLLAGLPGHRVARLPDELFQAHRGLAPLRRSESTRAGVGEICIES